MKKINIQLILIALLCYFNQPVTASDWTYDFEDFFTQIKGEGPKKAIDANLNGLDWHMYGVRSSVNETDYFEGTASMRIYGEISSAAETPNFTLTSPRDIGTFKFMIGPNMYWQEYQVQWIVQWSLDGETWTTAGEPFQAGLSPVEISRTIDQKAARVRIVRADYAEYNHAGGGSYSYIANIDNMTITDMSNPTVTLTTSVSELDFGEITLGESIEKSFTMTYGGAEGNPEITVKGDDASAFTFTNVPGEDGTNEITVKCTASHSGAHSAFINIVYGGLETNVNLTAVGKDIEVSSDWTYDFEDFFTQIKGQGPKKAIDANLKGLDWHMYGVRSSFDQSDYFDGEASMRLYGEISGAAETPNFTLTSPTDIGTFKFMIGSNAYWQGYQVQWIVQWSLDGNSWTTVGEPFQAGESPVEISRTINQKAARVRIVRADYAEYDHASAGSYSYIANIDNMTITGVSGPTITLTTSVSELDFGELILGESLEKSFTMTYGGAEGNPEITVKGDNASAFTFTNAPGEDGTDEITVKCTSSRRGVHSAYINIVYGELATKVNLTAVGKKANEGQLFSGGEGTEDNPYLISSDMDLMELSEEVENKMNTFKGKYFKMTNNIDMKNATDFRSIGNNFGRSPEQDNYIRPFSGTFDGDGYTIHSFNPNYSERNFCGLFGIITEATIKNLTISKSRISGNAGVAALVGLCYGEAVIENCHTTADVNVEGAISYTAGICGGAMSGNGVRISDCTNAATVTGEVGITAGILSYSSQEGTIIERCGNYGTITDLKSHVGGIIASVKNGITINDCFNSGEINMVNEENAENTRGGGILGTAETFESGMIYINNCYNVGILKTQSNTLHPIFDISNAFPEIYSLQNNYYSKEINGMSYAGEPEEVAVLTVAEMKSDEFLKKLNREQEIWIFKEGVNNGFPVPEGNIKVAVKPMVDTSKPSIAIVDGKLSVSGNCTDVMIYDVNGKLISANTSLARGIYIVKMNVDGKLYVSKIMY